MRECYSTACLANTRRAPAGHNKTAMTPESEEWRMEPREEAAAEREVAEREVAEREVAEREPRIEILPTGSIEANCYLVTCPQTGETMIVDPGAEAERILARVRERALSVVSILHTHGHFDHIAATEAVLAGLERPVPVQAHPADAFLYTWTAREVGAQ